MYLGSAVVAFWSLKQEMAGLQVQVILMTNIFVTEFAEFAEKHFGKTLLDPLARDCAYTLILYYLCNWWFNSAIHKAAGPMVPVRSMIWLVQFLKIHETMNRGTMSEGRSCRHIF